VVEALGQTARFISIYEEYRKAPEVTRKRMYLETMERIMHGTDKIIIDSTFGRAVVPYALPRAAGAKTPIVSPHEKLW
jgi:modulator of FtsH protease HflK